MGSCSGDFRGASWDDHVPSEDRCKLVFWQTFCKAWSTPFFLVFLTSSKMKYISVTGGVISGIVKGVIPSIVGGARGLWSTSDVDQDSSEFAVTVSPSKG